MWQFKYKQFLFFSYLMEILLETIKIITNYVNKRLTKKVLIRGTHVFFFQSEMYV